MEKSLEAKKKEYMQLVYAEMLRRGFIQSELETIIAKTGFIQALNEYPEESLHYPVESSVDEIILVASE